MTHLGLLLIRVGKVKKKTQHEYLMQTNKSVVVNRVGICLS